MPTRWIVFDQRKEELRNLKKNIQRNIGELRLIKRGAKRVGSPKAVVNLYAKELKKLEKLKRSLKGL